MIKRKVLIVAPFTDIGEDALELLGQVNAPSNAIGVCDADPRAAPGLTVKYRGHELPVGSLSGVDFSTWGFAIFCGAPHLSEQYARKARGAGCVVIDTTDALTKPGYDPKDVRFVEDFNPRYLQDHPGILVVPSAAGAAKPGYYAIEVLIALRKMAKQAVAA